MPESPSLSLDKLTVRDSSMGKLARIFIPSLPAYGPPYLSYVYQEEAFEAVVE